MTLMDLARLIRKYWIVVVASILIVGGAGTAFAVYKVSGGNESFTAMANIVGNSHNDGVQGLVNAEARQLFTNEGKLLTDPASQYKYEVSLEKGSSTVVVSVTGPEEDECIRLANAMAENAYEQAVPFYADYETPYAGHVEKAAYSITKESSVSKKLILAAILAGLFLGVCIVVVIDLIRRPIKSIEGMQDAVEIPVLEKLPASNGERLLANVRFASKVDDLKRVCVVPLGEGDLAGQVADLMRAAIEAEQGVGKEVSQEADDAVRDAFYVQACSPLSVDMSAAYESRGADAVIIAGRQWRDSLTALESTVAELKLAGANVAGLVFVQGSKHTSKVSSR